MTSPPPFSESLRVAFDTAETLFRWIDTGDRAGVKQSLLEGLRSFPFAADFQSEGEARIERCIPLFAGPSRWLRLEQIECSMTLLADPAQPNAVFAALGPNLPPQLWPAAEATPEGVLRELAPYLSRPFVSSHRLSQAVRIHRGSLDELGVESIDLLARIIARSELWIDGSATWRNGQLDDPWPDDPSSTSMLLLRAISERASQQHGLRWPRISMRTLWSRSVLALEQTPWGDVVFELRYDPVSPLPALEDEGVFPKDLPADLRASLLRGPSVTLPRLDEAIAEQGLTPFFAVLRCMLAPASSKTFAMLHRMVRSDDEQVRSAGLSIASDLGARGLLYELACESDDELLRARLHQMTRLHPPRAAEPNDPADGFEDDDDAFGYDEAADGDEPADDDGEEDFL